LLGGEIVATVRVSVSFDGERDAALLSWLEAQPNKSEAIREALTARAEGNQAATLADVVRAIESLGQRLAGLQVMGAPAPVVEEDPELAAALDSLGI